MGKLLILDDIFPLELSAFRYQEFIWYLKHFEDSLVFTTGKAISMLAPDRSLSEVIAEFEKKFPELAGRVRPMPEKEDLSEFGDLIYFVFLGNLRQFEKLITKSQLPFVFTLYPGGSFYLYHAGTNNLLRSATALECFKRVIVTQGITADYLVDSNFCQPEKIVEITGVVVPEEFLKPASIPRLSQSDRCCNICFVAHKYSPQGIDKGYDVFIEVARKLLLENDNIRFHIVGGFQSGDVEDSDIKQALSFYEPLSSAQLIEFFDDMDILISPNRAGTIQAGQFDGFPTGAAVQAALRGVAVFASDCLWQNKHFVDGEDLCLISHSPAEISALVSSYVSDRQKLSSLRRSGYEAVRRLYSLDAQMKPRARVIQEELDRRGSQELRAPSK